MRGTRETGSSRSEVLCSRKDGTPFWFGLHLMQVRGSTSQHFVVLGRDITESLQARQQQAAVQGLLAKVFVCVSAPVAIVSDTGFIQMTNPALDKLLGYPAGSLSARRPSTVNAPSARAGGYGSAAAPDRGRPGLHGGHHGCCAPMAPRLPVEITSTTVQRDDLRRFRIVTVLQRPDASPVTVHVAGKIRLIGLDEVKEALGSRWAAVAARAMASAEHVIKRHCGPRDTWSRTADGGFLICFADTTEDEAGFRAAAMGREIRTRLVGEGETEEAAHVSAIAAAVDVPNVPGRSVDMLATAINERLNSRLAEIETRARETLRQAVQITSCRLEPVRSVRTRAVVANFARLPSERENRILAAYSTLPMNERQDFDFDRLVLGVAAEQAINEIAEGGSQLILVNVDFDVFQVRRRTERYVAACRALDNRLRERLVLVLSGIPKAVPKSRVLECVMRLRPFCHSVGFQSDSMEAPSVEFSLLGTAFVVLQDDGRAAARDPVALGKLIESLHAHRASVLVRHIPSWEAVRPLARLGVDLVAITEDERDAAGA